jgi:outer membrane protein assembly factor BamB
LPQVVYALSSDGQLHTLGPYSGKDLARPLPFLPPGAHATDLITVNNIVYAATMNGCGGVADGVWALELTGGAVKTWRTDGGSPTGPPSFGTDGTLYVAIGPRSAAGSGGFANAVVALDPRELTVKDWFIQPGVDFVTSPVVFKSGERDIVAAVMKDGSIVLLDAASLGGPTHAAPHHRSAAAAVDRSSFVPGGLATWEDSGGTRWLLVPTATTVVAMKVTSTGGTLSLTAGWTARDMRAPLAPIVVNGVAFVVSSGEYVPPGGARVSAADRARQSVAARLHALDAATGRELWTSGNAIRSFAHGAALWPGIGQVHVATYDNTVYAFGFPLERY